MCDIHQVPIPRGDEIRENQPPIKRYSSLGLGSIQIRPVIAQRSEYLYKTFPAEKVNFSKKIFKQLLQLFCIFHRLSNDSLYNMMR